MVLATLQDTRFAYEYHDEEALTGLNLELLEGRLYGIVGSSGAGKSTLCALLRGIVPHFHKGRLDGTVKVLGRDLLEWDPADLAVRIGYVFQNPHTQISGVKPTVFEEIALGLEHLGMDREAMFHRVEEVIEQLGLQAIAHRDPTRLSGGQCQRVAFASILAMDPDVYVIDEPTSQLDPESAEDIFRIIRTLRDAGKTIVLAEHNIDLLARHADEVIVLHAGRVAVHGPTADVLASPALQSAGVRPPEVLELALLLRDQGKDLGALPIIREDAETLVRRRAEEVLRGDQSR